MRQVAVRWDVSRHARRLLTLALAGLVTAMVTGRPEFAGLTAPAVLLLATWRSERPASVGLRVTVTDPSIVEGLQSAIRTEIGGVGEFDTELCIDAADDVRTGAPVVVAANGRAALPFAPLRWGNRPIGMLRGTLQDRHRLAEGNFLVSLPSVTCLPDPAMLTSSVVLQPAAQPSRRAPGQGDRRRRRVLRSP